MIGDTQERISGAARNVAFKFLSEVVGKMLLLFYAVLLTHFLNSELFGRFTFALTLGGMLALISDLGLPVIASREIARVSSGQVRSLFARLVNIKVLVLIPIALISLGLYLFWPADSNIPASLPAVLTISIALTLVMELFASALRARFRGGREALLFIFQRGVLLLGTGGLLLLGGGLVSVGWAHLLASASGVVVGFLLLTPLFGKGEEAHFVPPKRGKLLSSALPVFAASLFITAYFRIDILLLRWLGVGDGEIGHYGAAFRLIDAIMVLPALFIAGIFPALSSFFSGREKVDKETFRKSGELSRVLAVLGFGITLLLFPLTEPLVRIAFGAEFAPSSAPLRILLWALPLIFINYLLYYLIIAMDRQKLNLIPTAVCLVFNLTLNLLLIPHFGIMASAAVTIGTELVLFAFLVAFTFRRVAIPAGRLMLVAVGAVLCGGFQVWSGGFWGLAGLIVFIGWSFLVGGITPADFTLVFSALRRRGVGEGA